MARDRVTSSTAELDDDDEDDEDDDNEATKSIIAFRHCRCFRRWFSCHSVSLIECSPAKSSSRATRTFGNVVRRSDSTNVATSNNGRLAAPSFAATWKTTLGAVVDRARDLVRDPIPTRLPSPRAGCPFHRHGHHQRVGTGRHPSDEVRVAVEQVHAHVGNGRDLRGHLPVPGQGRSGEAVQRRLRGRQGEEQLPGRTEAQDQAPDDVRLELVEVAVLRAPAVEALTPDVLDVQPAGEEETVDGRRRGRRTRRWGSGRRKSWSGRLPSWTPGRTRGGTSAQGTTGARTGNQGARLSPGAARLAAL